MLVLTTYETDDHILAAIEAGASGYLLKAAPQEEILAGIRSVAAGETVLAPSIAAKLVRRVRADASTPAPPTLSPRELDVLRLVADGRRTRDRPHAAHRRGDGEDPPHPRLREARRERPDAAVTRGDGARAPLSGRRPGHRASAFAIRACGALGRRPYAVRMGFVTGVRVAARRARLLPGVGEASGCRGHASHQRLALAPARRPVLVPLHRVRRQGRAVVHRGGRARGGRTPARGGPRHPVARDRERAHEPHRQARLRRRPARPRGRAHRPSAAVQPSSRTFPSGHSASAAAFTAGVALESPRVGAALAPVALGVAYSRLHTGRALAVRRGRRARDRPRRRRRRRGDRPPAARPSSAPVPPGADRALPAAPDGEGVFIVVNRSAGTSVVRADPPRRARRAPAACGAARDRSRRGSG